MVHNKNKLIKSFTLLLVTTIGFFPIVAKATGDVKYQNINAYNNEKGQLILLGFPNELYSFEYRNRSDVKSLFPEYGLVLEPRDSINGGNLGYVKTGKYVLATYNYYTRNGSEDNLDNTVEIPTLMAGISLTNIKGKITLPEIQLGNKGPKLLSGARAYKLVYNMGTPSSDQSHPYYINDGTERKNCRVGLNSSAYTGSLQSCLQKNDILVNSDIYEKYYTNTDGKNRIVQLSRSSSLNIFDTSVGSLKKQEFDDGTPAIFKNLIGSDKAESIKLSSGLAAIIDKATGNTSRTSTFYYANSDYSIDSTLGYYAAFAMQDFLAEKLNGAGSYSTYPYVSTSLGNIVGHSIGNEDPLLTNITSNQQYQVLVFGKP